MTRWSVICLIDLSVCQFGLGRIASLTDKGFCCFYLLKSTVEISRGDGVLENSSVASLTTSNKVVTVVVNTTDEIKVDGESVILSYVAVKLECTRQLSFY